MNLGKKQSCSVQHPVLGFITFFEECFRKKKIKEDLLDTFAFIQSSSYITQDIIRGNIESGKLFILTARLVRLP
jgi:hypothetical protein